MERRDVVDGLRLLVPEERAIQDATCRTPCA